MRAFLLAAGRGTRISKNIPEIPKCTLNVGEKPLILNTIEMLLSNNIDVTIIVGYKHDYIREILKDYSVEIVYNPFFDVTNSIGSLWFAKESIKLEKTEDIIIANADVYWTQEILDCVLNQKKDVFMLADSSRAIDGDYFFYTENNTILKYGKELNINERNCEYVGIAFISKSFIVNFKQRLQEMVEKQQHSWWWENVLYSYIKERNIYSVDINGMFWAEIDFIEDYKRITDYVNSK